VVLQYVSAEKEKQCEQQATRECTSERNPSRLYVSSKSIIDGASEAGGFSQILSKCTRSSRSSHLTENEGKERENHKSENFAANIISTGDAAQDMLNLYLGPFLKKSPHEEQKFRVIESEGLPLVQTIESKELPSVQTIASKGLPAVQTIHSTGLPSIQEIKSKGLPSVYELNKQFGSCALSKEEAHMMKKKSSLKDKVAMFFD